jgi:two-component system chemotaxis response regulator CheY
MSKKVLVVDDSKTVRLTVKAMLTIAGYEVLEAVDGLTGAKLITSDNEISMVICDMNMPNMNGIQMLATINALTNLTRPPVLMMTSEGSHALVRQAKDAGAKAWIVKPFKPDVLVAAVQRLARE